MGEGLVWISAKDAHLRLGRLCREGIEQSKTRLVRIAADEFVRARCRRMVERFELEGKVVTDSVELTSHFWDAMLTHGKRSDWDMGEFETKLRQTEDGDYVTTTVHGVQFCAGDIYDYGTGNPRLATAGAPDPPQAPSPGTGYATDAEVRAWFEALPPGQQSKGIRWLFPTANKALAPRRVLRKQIEPFVKDRPRGRPRKQ